MKTKKVERTFSVYKHEFDEVALSIFGDHYLDRVSLDLENLAFKIRYMVRHGISIGYEMDRYIQLAHDTNLALSAVVEDILRNNILQYSEYDYIDFFVTDMEIDAVMVKFTLTVISDNDETLREVEEFPETFRIFENQFFRINTESYNDAIAKVYPELFEEKHVDVGEGSDGDVFCHNLTFQVTEDCSLRCSYCYQHSKTSMNMNFGTAKTFVDKLLRDKFGYINRYNSPAIILEFIGGEPFLETDLIREIYEYFLDQTYQLDHPWFDLHRVSICSNGLAYMNENVQNLFRDYSSRISFNISIDGNKELHDACRVQPNGEGSYDIAMAALNHYNKYYSKERNSKMTLAPQNITYLFDSVVDFIEKGAKSINLNCVFEEGWNQETALIEYTQLKRLADWLIDNDLENLYISVFNDRQEERQSKDTDGNFCFKAGTAVLTENGYRPIEDTKNGDILYTASGSKHVVTKMTKYTYGTNKIVKVRGSYPIHCTDDHKFFARVKTSDKHYKAPEFIEAGNLKKGDLVALPLLDLQKNTDRSISINMAYAIGVFLADGHINNGNVVITPGYDEDEYYADFFQEHGFEFTRFRNRTTWMYTFNPNANEINRQFYEICLTAGHLAHNKHFPPKIFDLHPDLIRECIRGYTDTDGYTVPEEKGSSRSPAGLVKINSASKWMMDDLMILLRSLGETPTCYYYPRAGEAYIEGRRVNVRDRYEVYYLPGRSVDKTHAFRSDPDYPVIWSTVNDVLDDPDVYEVYCPTVMPIDGGPEEHTIIVEGVAVHQCGGGAGSMLSIRPNGDLYPCIRYMPSSIGNESMKMGNVFEDFIGRNEGSEILHCMDENTRRSQSNDICYDCPIGSDCANCSALGYEVYGDLNKRTTFTCIQMIAEALANVYYFNRLNIAHPEYNLGVRKNNVPDEWALLVIDQDELDELKLLEGASMLTTLEYRA